MNEKKLQNLRDGVAYLIQRVPRNLATLDDVECRLAPVFLSLNAFSAGEQACMISFIAFWAGFSRADIAAVFTQWREQANGRM